MGKMAFASTTPPPPSTFSSSNLSNLCFEASGTFRSHPGTFIRVQIIFLTAELLQIRLNSIMELKVLILELYLVNPCVAEQKTLIVLLVDTPFAGRIASPLV
ncbi:hypothetical protein E3N88_43729 [Mikania micrantha]|uniref:Uncharacterized protein n=1 Tax=Mikania micrantha TaxID=192012 RepID=A0A5N6LEL9_9ASTR|nr:hypothetical protein E3N88_43729 [Mikania micrantha]